MNGAALDQGPMERRRGFTMVELLLAVGLLSILILALLRLLDTALGIWGRTDENRELSEMSAAVMELLSEDIHALEGGARGDLLADWTVADLDGDGIRGAPRQRLRLVRHVDAAALTRMAEERTSGPEEEAAPPARETFDRGLAEVAWVLLPSGSDRDQRAIGTLWRGERALEEKDTLSFFDPGFFGPLGKPVPGSLHELTGGVLWFEVWFATQTSILHQGWELGDELSDCGASWDAWSKGRPDQELSVFNQAAEGMPQAKEAPLLPRRVRLVLELERPADLRLRTRLVGEVLENATSFDVRDGRKLPQKGALVLIDEEWMRVLSVEGNRASVARAQRATRAAVHPAGALVHHGWRSVREVSVDMTREDWDL